VAAERTLAGTDAPPDILLYVSENDTRTVDSLARLLDRLGLPEIRHLALSGHDCGNLAPALAAAREMIAADVGERILLVLADRALHARHRVMASKLSVFSDGAASCLVTEYEPIADRPRFRVEAIGIRSRSASTPRAPTRPCSPLWSSHATPPPCCAMPGTAGRRTST